MARSGGGGRGWMWGLLGLLGLAGYAGTASAAAADDDDDDDGGGKPGGIWKRFTGGGGGGGGDGPGGGGPGSVIKRFGGGGGKIWKGYVPSDDDDDDPKPTRALGEDDDPKPTRAKGDDDDDDDDPGGPKPNDIWTLIKTYPTPSSYYQVLSGDNFTGDQGIATRLARTALFLAARDVGGLEGNAANAWASERLGYSATRVPVTKWIACAPFNDAAYATYAFSDKSIPGFQGRAIRLLSQHADNALRIAGGEAPIRNVRLCAPGDAPSCSGSPVDGDYRKRELLWMPGFDLDALWESDGKLWRPGGEWGDGTSHILPPPKIWALGLVDLSGSGLSQWGCTPYKESID